MIHLQKLCVGAESVEDLARWQAAQAPRWPAGRAIHVTRMFPKNGDVIGGSLYWVIKGLILCRQEIVDLLPVEQGDGITRCAIHLDPAILRTEAVPRRPFQGWRYLAAAEAPRDLTAGRLRDEPLPPGLARALTEIGVM